MKNIMKILAMTLAMLMIVPVAMGCTPDMGGGESTPPDSSSNTPDPTQPESSESASDSSSESASESEPGPEPVKSDFEIYQSNIAYGTSHNALIEAANGKELATYRAIFPVEEYGELEYKLFFSNNMDASSRGFSNYPDKPTADYKIHYAALRTTTNFRGLNSFSDATVITFDGKGTRDVKAGEMFWSDPVKFCVNEGEFLVYEWTVEYTKIPATIVASTYYTYKANATIDAFPKLPGGAGDCPLPDLIGASRDGIRLTFIGDSITMGTGSGAYQNSFWVKQISDRLGTGYSVWNIGLDSGRADDVIRGKSWKEKLKNTDILSICIGINDVMSVYGGKPQTGAEATAADIVKSITDIAAMGEEAGAEIILFSVPPFNLTGGNLYKWQAVNRELKTLAEEKGYSFFDFAAVLGDPADPSKCIYGDHPNKEGCTAVADAFMKAGILEPKN